MCNATMVFPLPVGDEIIRLFPLKAPMASSSWYLRNSISDQSPNDKSERLN